MRVAYFYLQQLRAQIRPAELFLMGKHQKHMMKWVRDHLFPAIKAGKEFPDYEPEWANDTREKIKKWCAPYLSAGNNDMLILHAVGKNLAPIARGIMPAL